MNKKTIIPLLIGVVFSAIGFYFAFRNVPMSALWHYAKGVNYGWTLPAALTLGLAYTIRSVRWQWLLLPAKRIKLSSAYHSLIISMMINCLLPGRVGELARPMVLKKQENLHIASSLASLGVERLLDLLALLLLLLPTVILAGHDTIKTISYGDLQLDRNLLIELGYMASATALLLIGAVLFIGHDKLRSRFMNWLREWPDRFKRRNLTRMARILHRYLPVLERFCERSAQGVKYICNLKGLFIAIAISLLFWVFNALTFYFLAVGSPDLDISFTQICGVMVIICFFIALPSVPGFWGLWEAAGVFALSIFGVSNDVAAGYSLFSHAFSTIPVIIAGWLSSIALGFRWSGLTRDETADSVESESRTGAT